MPTAPGDQYQPVPQQQPVAQQRPPFRRRMNCSIRKTCFVLFSLSIVLLFPLGIYIGLVWVLNQDGGYTKGQYPDWIESALVDLAQLLSTDEAGKYQHPTILYIVGSVTVLCFCVCGSIVVYCKDCPGQREPEKPPTEYDANTGQIPDPSCPEYRLKAYPPDQT